MAIGRSNISKQLKPKLGTGKRFKSLTTKLKKSGAKDPKALAAYIGRKKYGKKNFQKLLSKKRRRRS